MSYHKFPYDLMLDEDPDVRNIGYRIGYIFTIIGFLFTIYLLFSAIFQLNFPGILVALVFLLYIYSWFLTIKNLVKANQELKNKT